MTTTKHVFLYDRSYAYTLDPSVQVNRYSTEQQCAAAVILAIASIKGVVIVQTFNGSSSLFDDGLGYDIPWLFKRSTLKLTPVVQKMKFVEDFRVVSQMITGVQELPLVSFLDLQVRLEKTTTQD